jgi:hypothetical protein
VGNVFKGGNAWFDPFHLVTPKKSGGSAVAEGTAASVASQNEALEYLKEVDKLPREFREQALKRLAGAAGVEGGTGTQQDLIDTAKASPLYSAIMGSRAAGEEAILRQGAATGGLRSGNMQDQLFSFNANLENEALLKSYNDRLQGLQGLAALPSNANNIATSVANIGNTKGQGIISAQQADASQQQALIGNLMGLAGVGAGMFSDRRLKKDIELIGKVNGYNWYKWTWNSIGNAIGLTGSTQGVLADEIVDQQPATISLRDGYLFVNYELLGGAA